MRCSRRSTTWSASALACALAATVVAETGTAAPDRDVAVREAITLAVVARTGDDVRVAIDALTVRAQPAAGPYLATPEPSARSGRPAVFALAVPDPVSPGRQRRIGSAVATVRVSGPHARTARALPRGTVLARGDLREANEEVDGLLLGRLPAPQALVGGRTARDLREGEIVAGALVQAVPAVKSGDEVRVTVRLDGLDVQGRGIATQSGTPGTVIRVVNPDSRRAVRARVIGPGEVEVIHDR
jgi:flagella basal body P-ring formation protein FlgA